jgi:dinuclear metal center YbgI/SA1388 family protein
MSNLNAISPHSRTELEQYLNTLLQISKVKDYCPNGLQVAGKETITHIVTGVSATQALIDEAVEVGADAILVHHGYFWKNENPCVVGMKKQRLKTLLQHDINLFAYHLPLDVHETLGNNAQLANLLGVELIGGLDKEKAVSVPVYGQLASPMSLAEFSALVTLKLQRPPLVEAGSDKLIKTIGICTGGAQGYIELAAEQGLDAYLTGEVSEQTIHVAREMGIHFIAAGHHATERYGVKALGEHLQHQLGVQVTFIDIDNPA